MSRVAVVGTTSWGATIAQLLARNGHDVRLLARSTDEVASINRTRRVARAPDLALDDRIHAHADGGPALEGVTAVVFVVPSQSMRANARAVAAAVPADAIVLHATKGFERDSLLTMSAVLREELPQLDAGRVCALSGPNLAREIQRGLPAATVIGGTDAASVARAQVLLHQPSFRVYASDDLSGVAYAGSLKNVIAIAAGIADGLGFGDNAKAGIITRGLAEITRLGIAAGALPMTFAGLAGMGDVIATCYSSLSRNRTLGEAMARGNAASTAVASADGVVEGVEATAAGCALANRHGVEMPIAEALRGVLFEGAPTTDMVRRLLEREPTTERR